jgi:hypothetical protein
VSAITGIALLCALPWLIMSEPHGSMSLVQVSRWPSLGLSCACWFSESVNHMSLLHSLAGTLNMWVMIVKWFRTHVHNMWRMNHKWSLVSAIQNTCRWHVMYGLQKEKVLRLMVSFRGPMIACANCGSCRFDHSLRGLSKNHRVLGRVVSRCDIMVISHRR